MMRKITKLMLTLALLIAGVGGVNGKKYYADLSTAGATGNATWTAGTNTFAWTQSSYAYMVVPGGSFSGDLSQYTTIGLTVSDIDNEFRVDILANGKTFTGKSITTDGNVVLNILNDFNLQYQADKITTEDLKSVTAIRLNTNSAAGSAVVTNFYIAKPLSLTFDDDGDAEIPLSDLVATGGFSFDDQTGVLTSDGTSGTLAVNMPTEGVDFSYFLSLTVNRSGDDLVSNLLISDTQNSISNGFYSSKYGVNFTSGDAMKFNNAPNVNSLVWYSNSTAGTMTITSIKIKANVLVCTLPGTPVALNTLQYHNMDGTNATATWNMGVATDTYYGSGSSDPSNYVDLTEYEELRIYRDTNTGFRAFFINKDASNTNNINNNTTGTVSWNETENYWAIDLSKIEKYNNKVYLNTIKSESWGVNNIVKNIAVYKLPEGSPNYILNGFGAKTPAATAALADASATYIDATGITAATELGVANPNCLITANAGMVTNAQNVIVSGTCANLVLTDKKPFKAPVAFTATKASFEKTIGDAEYATMVLPFTADVPEGVVAREITGVSGDVLTTNTVTEVTANKPVLLKNTGTFTFEADDAAISATADGAQNNGLLYGVYATTNVPTTNSYVLQKQDDDVSFFKAIDGTTVDAFRAYLTTPDAARRLLFDFENEATGLQQAAFATQRQSLVYNLQGQRIAQPARGLYIKGGKKVIIK